MSARLSPTKQLVLKALARIANKSDAETLTNVLNQVALILAEAMDAKESGQP